MARVVLCAGPGRAGVKLAADGVLDFGGPSCGRLIDWAQVRAWAGERLRDSRDIHPALPWETPLERLPGTR